MKLKSILISCEAKQPDSGDGETETSLLWE